MGNFRLIATGNLLWTWQGANHSKRRTGLGAAVLRGNVKKPAWGGGGGGWVGLTSY